VLYVVVEAGERFVTLPVRALGEHHILDMTLANETASLRPQAEPRFRRAAKLVGQPITYPGGDKVGTVADIQFELGSGRVQDVVVRTEKGPFNLPPRVLAEGYFPPLTRWDYEYPTKEELGERGHLRGEPSDERRRIHEPRWDR
jgi:sporulation protein YlmC with PRC-barrel domain